MAALVDFVRAENLDPRGVGGGSERGQIYRCWHRRTTEDHVTVTGKRLAVPCCVGEERTDDHVIESVSVHVARTAHGNATVVPNICTEDGGSLSSRECCQINRGQQAAVFQSLASQATLRTAQPTTAPTATIRATQTTHQFGDILAEAHVAHLKKRLTNVLN